MAFTDVKPWEPGAFSSRQRFHAFSHVRDLPPSERSIRRGYEDHHQRCLGKSGSKRAASGRWFLWSSEDDWTGRLELWDAEVDRQKREKLLRAQLDAVERHQRACQAALSIATVPVRAIIERLNDPEFRAQLQSATALTLLRESWRAGAIVPALINAERQALGLTTAELVIEERRGAPDPVVRAITSDSAALDAACVLLDRAAATGGVD